MDAYYIFLKLVQLDIIDMQLLETQNILLISICVIHNLIISLIFGISSFFIFLFQTNRHLPIISWVLSFAYQMNRLVTILLYVLSSLWQTNSFLLFISSHRNPCATNLCTAYCLFLIVTL